MSDEEHSKCHCSHVVVIQTKLTVAQWFIGVLAVALVSLLISQVGSLVSLRVRSDAIGRSGERLGSDRIPEPQ